MNMRATTEAARPPRGWRPPRILIPDVGLWNALHAPRAATSADADPFLRVAPDAVKRLQRGANVRIAFRYAEGKGEAWAPAAALQEAAKDAGLWGAPPDSPAMRVLLAVLVEEAGAPADLRLDGLSRATAPPPAGALGIEVRIGETRLPLAIAAEPGAMRALLAALPPPERPALADLPVPLRIVIGRERISAAEFARLEPGGAIVPSVPLTPLDAVVHLGATHRARAFRRATSVMLMEGPRMADAATPDPAGEGSLDDIGIEVLFELDRQTIPLGRLRELSAGQILPLSREGRTPTVAIVAVDRRIATATLVTLGDTVALRIDRLFGR